jgi:hypothetical protein
VILLLFAIVGGREYQRHAVADTATNSLAVVMIARVRTSSRAPDPAGLSLTRLGISPPASTANEMPRWFSLAYRYGLRVVGVGRPPLGAVIIFCPELKLDIKVQCHGDRENDIRHDHDRRQDL